MMLLMIFGIIGILVGIFGLMSLAEKSDQFHQKLTNKDRKSEFLFVHKETGELSIMTSDDLPLSDIYWKEWELLDFWVI